MALPAMKGDFSFIPDSFYVEVRGNSHRRATIAELKSHFSDKGRAADNRPGHWYSAQLKHYGLAPSLNKATAKMRLWEAVQKSSLQVPPEIKKIEADLKREWSKRERAAKKARNTESPVKKRSEERRGGIPPLCRR